MREINMFIEVGKRSIWYIKYFEWSFADDVSLSSFCQCTESVTSICTLYEMGQAMAGLKNKKHYEELNLGPLCKLPLIHRMFKIDSNTKDDDIHQIETIDILKVSLKT